MTADAELLLQATSVCKQHGTRRVLDAVSLQAAPGDSIALMGPSGCGKTTLLHLLAGLDSADGGHIAYQLGGVHFDMTALDEAARTRIRRRWFGFVFQFYNLVPTLNVADNILLPRRLNGLPASEDELALARLERLGLHGRNSAWPAELSGGEQQRVAIARALAHSPQLVFADEPTGNLNVAQADEVLDLLLQHSRAAGAALIFATHSERLAARASRVLDLAAVHA